METPKSLQSDTVDWIQMARASIARAHRVTAPFSGETPRHRKTGA